MIIWLNDIPRRQMGIEPIHRIGFLDGKTHTVNRNFDHISFSMFTGKVNVMIRNAVMHQLLSEPCCTLAIPGDVRFITPKCPVNEFYFVYDAQYLPLLFPNGTNELKRVLPLRVCPIITEYAALIRKLLEQKLILSVCEQIDLLGRAILMATFRKSVHDELTGSEARITSIENELRHRYHEAIDLNDLAQQNGMSFTSFRRIWQETHTVSPHEFVMDLRNREACELLKDLTMPVALIAETIGYPDPQYFSRFFVRRNGCTPSQYRKHFLK